jgi:hypothetical protein
MKMPNIIGVFDTDDKVVDAIHTLKKNNISIADVHSPFASHHILKELGKESRIPYGSVLAGAFAIIGTFSFIYWTSVINYPIVFGGKPTFAFPSWVVVIYLVTILLTFIGTVIIFQMRTKMNFGDKPNLVHIDSTDDKFVMIIEQKEGSTDKDVEKIRKMLNDHGALEVLIDSGS